MLELSVASVSTDILDAGTYSDFKILPSWSDLTLSAEPGQPTSIAFTYPRTGTHAHMLISGARLRVTFLFTNDGIHYNRIEPPNMVFVVEEFSYNQDNVSSQVMTISGTSTMGRFGQLLLAPAIGSSYLDDDIFTYQNQTYGQLARNALSAALTRSPHTNIHFTFTDHHDSFGRPWGLPIDAKFNSGTTLTEVFDWLTSLGFAYPTMGFHKRWIPSQNHNENFTSDMLLDKASTTYSLHLYSEPLKGHGYRTYFANEEYEISVQYQEEFKNVVNQLFVTGADEICGWVKRDDSIVAYGPREGKWSVSNAALHNTILQAGERYLDVYAYPRTSQTLEMRFPPDGAILFYFPEFMFGKSHEKHQIQMVSIRVSSSNHEPTLTLTIDNYFDRRKALLDQRLARLGISGSG